MPEPEADKGSDNSRFALGEIADERNSAEALRLAAAYYRLKDALKRTEVVTLTERYADQT